ncbi:MAG: AAA family ATPase [Candidatus Thorarchaeota archaeon]
MILESIIINNIRSIKNLTIPFPQTTMLFFGDIGSGKSSVLKALEFALFGILTSADLSGDSLLRRGENKALVKLTFLIDEYRYTIERGLSKNSKGQISQTKGSLSINGSKISFAATDLRRKILEILNYSIPRYERAKSIDLFRYTVYTPQESVKEILEANPDTRFEILKDVFGIEKYEISLRNINIISDYLRDKIKEISLRIKQFENLEELIIEKEMKLKNQKSKINDLKKNREFKQKEIDNTIQDLIKARLKKEDFAKKIIELENKESLYKESQELRKKSIKELDTVQNNIKMYENDAGKIILKKLSVELNEKQFNEQISELRKQISSKEKNKAVIVQKIKDVDKLLEQGKCSLCGQEIHEEERFRKELNEAHITKDSISKELDLLSKEINKLEEGLQDYQEYKVNKEKKELYEKLLETSKKQEKDLKQQLRDLAIKIEKLQKELKEILSAFRAPDIQSLRKLEKEVSDTVKSIEEKVDKLNSEKSELEKKISAEEKVIEFLEQEINQIKSNIALKKRLNQKLVYLTDIRNWLIQEFPTLLRDIEREIMVSSANDFNLYFKEWFNILIEEGNIEVEIRPDDFQPLINVNGHDSPFHDLSGGEKSAISLAYRLGLNKIINERYQEIKTKDLLILDEPTDGFSQQQVNRMQEIFNTLNTSQMIIISHERVLDSFVTDIFTFKKRNHQTQIAKETI